MNHFKIVIIIHSLQRIYLARRNLKPSGNHIFYSFVLERTPKKGVAKLVCIYMCQAGTIEKISVTVPDVQSPLRSHLGSFATKWNLTSSEASEMYSRTSDYNIKQKVWSTIWQECSWNSVWLPCQYVVAVASYLVWWQLVTCMMVTYVYRHPVLSPLIHHQNMYRMQLVW